MQFANMKGSQNLILLSFLTAIVFSMIFLFFVRKVPNLVIWTVVFLYLVSVVVLIIFLAGGMAVEDIDKVSENYLDDNPVRSKFILVVFLGIFFFMFIVAFLKNWSKVKQAIEVVKAGTEFIGKVPSSLYIPLVMTIVAVFILGIYLVIFVFQYSAGDYEEYPTGVSKTRLRDIQYLLLLFWTIAVGWVIFLLDAINQFIIASTACIWYFNQDNYHRPVLRSFFRVFRYHLGSLSLGAFLVPTLTFFRSVQNYALAASVHSKTPNILANYFVCYARYLQFFIRHVNSFVYIQIAMDG